MRLFAFALAIVALTACGSDSSKTNAGGSGGGSANGGAGGGAPSSSSASDGGATSTSTASASDGGNADASSSGATGSSSSASSSSVASSSSASASSASSSSAGTGGSGDGIVLGDSGDPSSSVGAWSCSGTTGKTIPTSGNYWMTTFGASTATSGTTCDDPGDNCIGACNGSAVAQGLCTSSEKNESAVCERKVNYFVADADRYGCGARVLVTNLANQKKVVAFVIDKGPACSVEDKKNFPVLDASPAVNVYLTGEVDHGVGEVKVHVDEVVDGTPIGPVED